jgi:pimeloyl-ACP methyl ester carboxylesterase
VYLSAILAVVVVAIAIYLLWPVKAIEPRCERGATTAVILVHGFWSNAATWDRLVKLLNADTEFGNAYCFARFEYSSPRIPWNPLTRIPGLIELGQSLEAFLNLKFRDYKNWILVGHSQGGLVIQSYLKRKIDGNTGQDLAKILSVIMLATPNQGSIKFSILRRILFSIRPNPQAEDLKVLNPYISDLHRFIQERILQATRVSDNFCPLPFVAFYGTDDDIVPRASAIGAIPETLPLRANHVTIIQPKVESDERYLELRKAILHPVGHPSIFEIDRCCIDLKISPLSEPYTAHYGDKQRIVETDNRAERSLQVAFSSDNRCFKPFPVRYRTLNGFVQHLWGAEMTTTDQDDGAYKIEGKDLKYSFTPKKSNQPQKLENVIEVYGGFSAGNRDWHFHLNQSEDLGVHYRLFSFSLDLTGYAAGRYEISAPKLYFHKEDVKCGELCKIRGKGPVQQALPSSTEGVWKWELRECRSGVIDVAWDLLGKAPA